VTEFLAETLRPRIQMRIEMHECQLADLRMQRAQQGEGDAVLATECDEMFQPFRLLFDESEAFGNIAERDRKIADVGERPYARFDPGCGVRAIHEHAAGVTDGVRAEARAGAVGDADIEGDSRHRDRRRLVVARHAEEGGWCRKGWCIGHGVCSM